MFLTIAEYSNPLSWLAAQQCGFSVAPTMKDIAEMARLLSKMARGPLVTEHTKGGGDIPVQVSNGLAVLCTTT